MFRMPEKKLAKKNCQNHTSNPGPFPKRSIPPHYPIWVSRVVTLRGPSAKPPQPLFQVDGCSINPNRSLGPALVSKLRGDLAPFFGGLGGLLVKDLVALDAYDMIRWLGLHLKVLVGVSWCMLCMESQFYVQCGYIWHYTECICVHI